jgi:hypothetical protein
VAKVHILFDLTMKNFEKVSLQFELLKTYYSKIACNLSYTPNIFSYFLNLHNIFFIYTFFFSNFACSNKKTEEWQISHL